MVAFGGFIKVADTGVNGFALQNATPDLLTWVAPNDGNPHGVMVAGEKVVSSAETGGALALNFTSPDGTARNSTVDNGGHGVGFTPLSNYRFFMVAPGTTVRLSQSSALTLGASVTYAQLWGS